MKTNDFNEILNFFGNEEMCFVIIKRIVGREMFNHILEKTTNKKRMTKYLCDVSCRGNVYFMKGTKKAKPNCIILHLQDLPIDSCSSNILLLSRDYIENKKKQILDKTEFGYKAPKKYTREYLASLPYDTFLRTEYWKDVRQEKLRQSGNKCQICGSKFNLRVHHNTYKNHGDEASHLEDLVVLCENCHKLFHNRLQEEKEKH